MNIDSFSGAPPPQSLDMKFEKKTETEEIRAIEEASENADSKLDINRENINKKLTAKYVVEEDDIVINIYNAKGDLVRTIPPESVINSEQDSIDLIV
ncbi:MAG: hypothetical protein JRJ02_11950 [Deltaproteobacteria bacterium]|nr:hypothetical protein [Deltaproteobacteria bacterium]